MAEFSPHVTYSASADAVYVALAEGEVARTKPLDDRRLVDVAADGTVVGIEFVDASAGIDLRGIPERSRVEGLLREYNFPVSV